MAIWKAKFNWLDLQTEGKVFVIETGNARTDTNMLSNQPKRVAAVLWVRRGDLDVMLVLPNIRWNTRNFVWKVAF